MELTSLFTANELENQICGSSTLDLQVLQQATIYEGVNPQDQ